MLRTSAKDPRWTMSTLSKSMHSCAREKVSGFAGRIGGERRSADGEACTAAHKSSKEHICLVQIVRARCLPAMEADNSQNSVQQLRNERALCGRALLWWSRPSGSPLGFGDNLRASVSTSRFQMSARSLCLRYPSPFDVVGRLRWYIEIPQR